MKSINFNDWKTGKKKEYILNSTTLYCEQLTKVICPFDKTPIIFRYSNRDETCFCPNCNAEYSKNLDQDEINQQAISALDRYKKELQTLHNQTSLLEAKIKHAEKVGLIYSK